MVAERFDLAREEARAADALAQNRAEELAPFHGVPCTVKECFALKGMPHTSGLTARVGTIAEDDATVVARVREAGAIPLGSPIFPSFACGWRAIIECTVGPTTPTMHQGSSGQLGWRRRNCRCGSITFGLGSDIGGSIRLPAFFNGVFGHKPSGELVPGTGQYPIAAESINLFDHGAFMPAGRRPMATSEGDAWP